MLQQYLPFTVLKQGWFEDPRIEQAENVATVLTVYGIETLRKGFIAGMKLFSVATVLTVYGIETLRYGSRE